MDEKISFIEEIMDVDEGTLHENMVLSELEEWDSISILSLIMEMKNRYGIDLKTNKIIELKTVKDICDIIPD